MTPHYYNIAEYEDIGTVLEVTPAEYFDETGSWADWTDPEVIDELNKAGMPCAALEDSVLEFYDFPNPVVLEAFLEQHPDFIANTDFGSDGPVEA